MRPLNALTVFMKRWSGQVARRSALPPVGRARAQMMSRSQRRSSYRAQVAIEPVEDFLHHQVSVFGRDQRMTCIEDRVAFVVWRRAKGPKEGRLAGVDREAEIISSIDHQHR